MAAAIILIGVPGSGKSTIAQELVHKSSQAVMISPDRVRQQLYGDAAIQGEWEQIWREIEQLFAQANADQCSIVYDATNYRSVYRRAVIGLARQYLFHPINGWWLNEPLWICLMRNQHRDRVVPDEVIIDMYRQLLEEPPKLEEGFDNLLLRQEKNESEWMD